MKTAHLILFITIIFLTSNCSAGMTGTVVDAETGKPIEGAVVLVEWIITKGLPGLTHHETYREVEVLTSKEGKFKVTGVYNPLVKHPDITIYKKGYIAWSNRIIFPDYRSRTDYKYHKNYVFRLERFKTEYTHRDHTSFIDSAIRAGMGNKKLMQDAYYWEAIEASKERDRLLQK